MVGTKPSRFPEFLKFCDIFCIECVEMTVFTLDSRLLTVQPLQSPLKYALKPEKRQQDFLETHDLELS